MSRAHRFAVVGAAIVSLCAGAAFAAPDNDETQKRFEKYCASTKAPNGERFAERIDSRLQLKDAQKPALNELRDAFAKSMADQKTALCKSKPDFATTPGRFAFAKGKIEARLERMKAIEPKLTAFYGALDDKQKASFDEMGLWSPHKRKAAEKKAPEKSDDKDDDQ